MKYDVDAFETRFNQYARSFLEGVSPEVARGIQLKITHTLMVRRECRAIAASEGWTEEDAGLGEIIGLAHDFGRFEQFRQFQTFADAVSLNHALFGVQLLEELHLLDFLEEADRATVLNAVRCHNMVALPENLCRRDRRFAMLIRDGDKLDIMRVLVDYYANDCENEEVTMGLKNIPEVTPEVAEILRRHESPRYTQLNTIPDFILTTASWAYDLNYRYTKAEYLRRGLLDTMYPYIRDVPVAAEIFREVKQTLIEETSA